MLLLEPVYHNKDIFLYTFSKNLRSFFGTLESKEAVSSPANMNRDEKDKYCSNSLMPKPESLRGKKIALFGLSANPPTGYQGTKVQIKCIIQT